MSKVWDKIFDEGGVGMVKIICDDGVVYCPETVLCLTSEFMKKALTVNMKEKETKTITLQYKLLVVKNILFYVCTGELIYHKEHNLMISCAKLADYLQINDYIELYFEKLFDRNESMHKILDTIGQLKFLSDDLKNKCLQKISWNIVCIKDNKDKIDIIAKVLKNFDSPDLIKIITNILDCIWD